MVIQLWQNILEDSDVPVLYFGNGTDGRQGSCRNRRRSNFDEGGPEQGPEGG